MDDDATTHRAVREEGESGYRRLPPLAVSDRALVERIRAGDENAFDLLFRSWYPRLVGFAESLVTSPDVAEDVVAEVFQRIWSRHAAWAPDVVLGAYFFRAVRNESIALQRRVRRTAARMSSMRGAGDSPGVARAPSMPDAAIEASELQQQIWTIVDAMPEARRAAAHLRWQEGMEYADIARILGISSAAVQMHVSRALQALRALLGEGGRSG